MTRATKRDIERQLDDLDGSDDDMGERPEPLSDEDRDWLDDFFSPPFADDHDEQLREMSR